MLISFSTFGQVVEDSLAANSDNRTEEIIFTKAEVMPKFKNGVESFTDTLKKYLLNSEFGLKRDFLCLRFVVDKLGNVKNMDLLLNKYPYLRDFADKIVEFIKNYNGLILPARQNSYPVNCYKSICIDVTRKEITVTETN